MVLTSFLFGRLVDIPPPGIFEEFERLFKASLASILVAIFAGISRIAFTEEKRTLGVFIRGLILAIFVGFLVDNLLRASGVDDGTKTFAIAVCAFCADDLLVGVLALGKRFRQNPAGTIKTIIKMDK